MDICSVQDICSFLSNLLHSVLKALSSSTSLELSQMRSFFWLWVIPFNRYKKWTIFLPWRIVYILVLVDCVFTRNVNPSLMFTMSCSWSGGLMTFWLSFSSGLFSGRCSVLPVTAHGVTWDTWLSPSGKNSDQVMSAYSIRASPGSFSLHCFPSLYFSRPCRMVNMENFPVHLLLFLNSFINFAAHFLTSIHPSLYCSCSFPQSSTSWLPMSSMSIISVSSIIFFRNTFLFLLL